MQHRGEIVEDAIRKSGYSISKLAIKLGKSRRWMYLMFDNPNLSIDYILKIGYLINHDFSEDIKQMKSITEDETKDKSLSEYHTNTVEHWREKYFELLEEYHQLLKKMN